MIFSNSLDCPKCGEENPVEASICWACYAPLVIQQDEPKPKNNPLEWHIHTNVKEDGLRIGLLAGGLLSWFASGYLLRRRTTLLTTGAISMASWIGWSKWSERTNSHRIAEQEAENTARYLDSVLRIAVQDGASQIRLQAGIGTQVQYLINGDWHDLMRLPAWVWNTLRPLLIEKTDRWQRPLAFEMNGQPFEFDADFSRDAQYPLEIVSLTLQ